MMTWQRIRSLSARSFKFRHIVGKLLDLGPEEGCHTYMENISLAGEGSQKCSSYGTLMSDKAETFIKDVINMSIQVEECLSVS
jgi:hypothetical protein